MNQHEFNEAILGIGGGPNASETLVWIAPDAKTLTQRPYNFVPVGPGLYEIWKPGGRGDYFAASVFGPTLEMPKFVGTLGEAYDWVFAERERLYGRRVKRGNDQPNDA
ncbi:hypothetical protein [Leucobacter denitrificans]|uniref:Uncharacterized protein n=1 Tax=Leucobacter denitrificans TaxID=683042 RepID=A0A7G9S261_9MICO|nr:hypothetical protein [Leucobacter denitrificans]QNN61936.1 hypothetical protein H9L06_06295 [Leucobacter denitrificans]